MRQIARYYPRLLLSRLGPVANRLSRKAYTLNLITATAVGTLAGAVTGAAFSEFSEQREVLLILLLLGIISGSFLIMLWAARTYSTTTSICILIWPKSKGTFADHEPVYQALRYGSREWHIVERAPENEQAAIDIIADAVAGIQRGLAVAADRSDQLQLSAAIVPILPDHLAFKLGVQASVSLLGVNLDLWGRLERTTPKNYTWGSKLKLPLSARDDVFIAARESSMKLSPDAVFHVISSARVPSPSRDRESSSPGMNAELFARRTRDSDGLNEQTYYAAQLGDTPSTEELVTIASQILSLSQPRGVQLRLRLNCGEVVAFALGVLVGNQILLKLQHWNADVGAWREDGET